MSHDFRSESTLTIANRNKQSQKGETKIDSHAIRLYSSLPSYLDLLTL